MTGSFTDIFGGGNIDPSQPSYLDLSISASVVLQWPIEQAMEGNNVVAGIMDITASVPGLTVSLSDATQVSNGYTALFNNVGAQTVSILDASGGVIVSLVPGTVWEIYLRDNSTLGGLWRVFQFGASVSVAVAAALAGAGLKAITATLNERMTVVPQAVNYLILDSDRATVQQWTDGVGTFTLPDPATVGADWFVAIKNSGSGNLTLNATAGNIDGSATAIFAPGGSTWVVTNGSNYFLVGEGGSGGGGSGFNLDVIDVSGSGNFVLAGAQLNQIGYRFTGALTGDRAIIVPGTAQEYWVDNETTGAHNLTVGTAGQVAPAPVTILQGNRSILYCDGTNVLPAETTTVSFPIAVNQGGTGAITAAAARTNLGATSVGNSLFTAVSTAAAQAAISVPPSSRLIATGNGLLGGGDLSADRTLTVDVGGQQVGYRNIPQNSQSGNYQLVLGDAAFGILHPNGAGAGHTYTVPANATVAFPLGTPVTIINSDPNSLAIAGAVGVTITVAGTATTGNRTLSQNGLATLLKIGTNAWLISGVGLG